MAAAMMFIEPSVSSSPGFEPVFLGAGRRLLLEKKGVEPRRTSTRPRVLYRPD
jgi:hypothetical protein